MRQALFAVMLVAASFAGGAVVNGPGLRWAQELLTDRFGLAEDDQDEGPPRLQPLVGDPSRPDGFRSGSGSGASSEIPARTIPPLAVEPTEVRPGPPAENAKEASPLPRAEAPAAAMGEAPPTSPKANSDVSRPETVELPTLTTTELPPLDRPEPPASPAAKANANEPPGASSPSPAQKALADAKLAFASIAVAATAEPEPRPEASGSNSSSSSSSGPGDPTDWPGVRRALQALGVARYGVEGEPGGRVRFHCVIPLAGRRAVSQYFEAEGEDEFQAAKGALRRVNLWRATEGSNAPL